MGARHTPGPWRTGAGACHTVYGHAVGRPRTSDPVVANCYSTGDNSKEDAANARLIAAAPDLLEALRRAHLVTCPTVDPIHHTCGGCSISAAIAKAEGK